MTDEHKLLSSWSKALTTLREERDEYTRRRQRRNIYYCQKCSRNHYVNKQLGKDHLHLDSKITEYNHRIAQAEEHVEFYDRVISEMSNTLEVRHNASKLKWQQLVSKYA